MKYTGDLFVVEPALLFGSVDNKKKMVNHYATDSLNIHFSDFEFKIFPSRPVAQSSLYK